MGGSSPNPVTQSDEPPALSPLSINRAQLEPAEWAKVWYPKLKGKNTAAVLPAHSYLVVAVVIIQFLSVAYAYKCPI
jgi:hypothetical protein